MLNATRFKVVSPSLLRLFSSRTVPLLVLFALACSQGAARPERVQSQALSGWVQRWPALEKMLAQAAEQPAEEMGADGLRRFRVRSALSEGASNTPAHGGYFSALPARITAEVSENGQTLRLETDDHAAVEVHWGTEAPSHTRLESGALRADQAGRESVVMAQRGGIEQLLWSDAEHADFTLAVRLDSGWTLRQSSSSALELCDARGQPRMRMDAPAAWDESGASVGISFAVEGSKIAFKAQGAHQGGVLIDPVWSGVGPMLFAHSHHTATVLPSAQVLIAGGVTGTGIASFVTDVAQLYDPTAGTFSFTGSLLRGRWLHTATLLPSGKVLVVGGQDTAGAVLSTAELYDPATGTFSPTGSLLQGRFAHSAILLAAGKVLIIGGQPLADDAGNYIGPALARSELYDPATGTFSETGPLQTGRIEHTATLLASGKVLVAGGYRTLATAIATAEAYDPIAGTFSSAGVMVKPRYAHTATLLASGKVLFAGGNFVSSAELYDPATSSFSTTGPLLEDRPYAVSVLLPNGRVLIAGGEANPAIGRAAIYDPITETFSEKCATCGDDQRARYFQTASLLPSGQVLLAGGTDSQGGLNAADIYVPDELSALSFAGFARSSVSLAEPRIRHSATLLPSGEVLVAGGKNSVGDVLGSAELYRPALGIFSQTGSLTDPRFGHTATILGSGQVLYAGGRNRANRVLASEELYDPVSRGFRTLPPLASARFGHTATLLPSGKVLIAGGYGVDGIAVGSIELVDPESGPTDAGSLLFPRALHTATLLRTGKVLFAGGERAPSVTEPASEVFDIKDGVTKFSGYVSSPGSLVSVALGTGDALLAGDVSFDQIFWQGGSRTIKQNQPALVSFFAAPLLLSGEALLCGRGACWSYSGELGRFVSAVPLGLPPGSTATRLASGDVLLLGSDFDTPQRGDKGGVLYTPYSAAPGPSLDALSEPIVAASVVTLTGKGFQHPSAFGTAFSEPLATTLPLAFFMPAEGGGPVFGVTRSWSDEELTWQVPETTYPGPGFLHVVVDGVPSLGRFVNLTGAPDATPCELDAQCGHGHCVGTATRKVCCNTGCSGGCEACLASEQVEGGSDGTCQPRPVGSKAASGCEPTADAVCSASGHCNGARDCDYPPTSTTCSSATVANGVCAAGSCIQAPPATCDAMSLQIVAPDGTMTPCAPFKCDAGQCLDSCTKDEQCSPGFRCNESGKCGAYCDESAGSVIAGPNSPPISCAFYRCRAGACLTSCAGDADCAAAQFCTSEGSCQGCSGDLSQRETSPQTTLPCAPYLCARGECLDACQSGLECAPGNHCDVDARCSKNVALSIPTDPGACAFGRAPRSTGYLLALSFGLLLTLGGLRRATARRRLLGVGSVVVALLCATRSSRAEPEVPPATPAATPSTSSAKEQAKAELKKGLALVKAGDLERALGYFNRSRTLFPAKGNTINAALCLDGLARYDEALELYEEVVANYSASFDDDDRASIPQAMSKLRGLVGQLRVSANVAGTVVIDGRERGKLPLSSGIRLLPGAHRVRVLKDGYATYEREVTIVAGQLESFDARLEPLAASGGLRVEAPSTPGADILVDGTRVGQSPWEGTLAPGPHVVVARAGELGSAPTQTTVLQGQTTLLRVKSAPLGPVVRLAVTPSSAELRLGEVTLGKGRWEGPLPRATYRVSASEAGYFDKTITLTVGDALLPSTVESIVLQVNELDPRWPKRAAGHFVLGAVAGYAVGSKLASDAEARCPSDCRQHDLVTGLSVGLHAGYEFPFGLAPEISAGHQSLLTVVSRKVSAGQLEGGRGSVTYDVRDPLRLNGYTLAAGASFKGAVAPSWALRSRLAAGLMVAKSSDALTLRATAGQGVTSAGVQGAGSSVSSTPFFVMSELGLERGLGALRLGVSLGALFVLSKGPTFTRGPASVSPGCSAALLVACARDSKALEDERAYRPFAVLIPQLSASYVL